MFGCASGPNTLDALNILRIGGEFFWLLDSALLKFEPSSRLAAISLRYLKWICLKATLDTGSGHFAILVMHRPNVVSPLRQANDLVIKDTLFQAYGVAA
jgi:hypothetical protein